MNPSPEAFAKTVLTELAHLRGESLATRTRLYQLMHWMEFPQPVQQMQEQDDKHIDDFQQAFLKSVLPICGLSHDSTPLDTQPPVD